jgi:hypothetical protein
LFIFGITISSYAEEEIEDLIDIAESKGKIIAVIEGRKTITSDRLLTFETSGSTWKEHRLY